IYSRAVNSETALDLVLRDVFPWCATWEKQLRELFASYVEAKQSQNVLDYDDLLLYWAQMVGETVIAEDIGSRFDHVLVDEYQDTNRLQASILLALKPQGQGLTVVGDDAQSIYSFRAATIRNILDFPAAFSPAANIVTLDRNYRSTQPILAAANAVIDLASERFTKNLWTERQSSERPRLVTVRDEAEQARYITDMVLDNREEGLTLKQQAVLFRTSHHSGPLEVELTRRNIPFVKFGGLKFLDSAHVKDMLAVLRFAQNPRDRVAGFRLMQILPGVGPSTAQKALDLMAEDASPISALAAMPAPPRSGEDWTDFVAMLQELKSGKAGWPAEIGLARQWYAPHLERLHEDATTRQADLLQLEQIGSGYASRERFLTELTLDPPDATSDQAGVPLLDEDYLILSTIHSAKGQEWTKVFMLNVVDGCIPNDLAVGTTAEIEEERRLLYVAMTRARDGLDLVVPQRFFTYGQNSQGDRHVYASRSRFIPATLLQFFEACSWPQGKSEAAQAQARQVRIDVGARMRGMWR
ncbi:ATP-dependent helicase, partial [Rhizobium ruizarguesonis]